MSQVQIARHEVNMAAESSYTLPDQHEKGDSEAVIRKRRW